MLSYFCNCVSWAHDDVSAPGGLSDMISERTDITRATFLKHVDRDSLAILESELGYERHHKQGLTMARDWHVSYHRSRLHGYTVYYFMHSAIEYVFHNEDSQSTQHRRSSVLSS